LFYRLMVMAGLVASIAEAQLGDYLGPSIMSRGPSNIGTRGGETVDLRFFASVNAIYDTGLAPLASDSSGKVVNPGGLYGVEAQVGAYGTHTWRNAALGLDYKGDFRHYNQQSYFDGSDQQLILGYSWQKSRRLKFETKGLIGTYSQGFGGVIGQTVTDSTGSVNPTTGILFDNRSTFFQGGMDATYLMSTRNSFTVGGDGYDVKRQSSALVGMHGYTLRGAFEHRLSMSSGIAVLYTHYHYDFPKAFGESNNDGIQLGYDTIFGRRRWNLRIMGGIIQTDVDGLQEVTLDPLVASILGVSTTVQTYHAKNIIPSGNASLTRRFKNSYLTFNYSRGISPGNGVYLTSRQENAGAAATYNGIRKTSLSISGAYNSLSSLGQSVTPYHFYDAVAWASYSLSHTIQFVARFDSRYQDITEVNSFKRTSYRTSIGVSFSPGDIPLTLW
jgi:hypothetical protein